MDGLSERQVAEIEQAAAGVAAALDELRRGPAIGGMTTQLRAMGDLLGPLREAYRAAGVERMRADLAVTEWVVSRLDPRACLAVAVRLDGR